MLNWVYTVLGCQNPTLEKNSQVVGKEKVTQLKVRSNRIEEIS